MKDECAIKALSDVINMLIIRTDIDWEHKINLQALRHLLSRFSYDPYRSIDLNKESKESKELLEGVFEGVYIGGLGEWKPGDLIYICHVTKAMHREMCDNSQITTLILSAKN